MKMYNSIQTDKVVAFGGASSIEKETLNLKWIDQQILSRFEGYLLPIPKEWDQYLTHFYGDYMTPPPVGEREDRHGIIECDFGNFDFSNYKSLL